MNGDLLNSSPNVLRVQLAHLRTVLLVEPRFGVAQLLVHLFRLRRQLLLHLDSQRRLELALLRLHLRFEQAELDFPALLQDESRRRLQAQINNDDSLRFLARLCPVRFQAPSSAFDSCSSSPLLLTGISRAPTNIEH